MDGVTIRPARDGDFATIVGIMYDEPGRDLLGAVPDPRKTRIVGEMILREGLELRPERTVVAEVEGRVVGLLETMRPGDDADVRITTALRVLMRGFMIVGPAGLWRFLRYRRARSRVQVERAAGSYYVAELDVHPSMRNRGIGGVLLSHAEDVARREGFSHMSLTTSSINPAQHLYTRHGFRIVEIRLDVGYERITGIPGRVLMIKDLETAATS